MSRYAGLLLAWLWSGHALSAISGAVASVPAQGSAAASNRVAEGFDLATLGQLLAGLVLVLVVFLGLAWLVRRSGIAGGFSHQGLNVIATLPLTTRERVVLVQAGSQQLLLGVAPGRVNLLQSFDQPLVESTAPAAPPFSQWLQRAMAKSSQSPSTVGNPRGEASND
ncbi:MAG: flagellar biosynthetic protein FliO [Halopseudomonas sp.]